MISKKIAEILVEDMEQFVTPSDEVAHLRLSHKLDHALLILTNVGFSVIPVLDDDMKFKGLVSMPGVMRAIMDVEDVNFDKLGDITVESVLEHHYAAVTYPFELEDVLRLLVHHAFVSVTEPDGTFIGIITRSELLKGTNRLAHELENMYDLVEKEFRTMA
ncbi:cyclic-di-AMP-binding protein CbpB [Atopococcus tabaci]|uniref:cyclic-di-AMP-binding protein CbpB n=1 Tax=Atopococcus tabaci TaxID=269774 RepID=UPI0004058337|nr:cyclic-di-AMP-binding protein CbpB [Atopococcus tabaci]